MCVSCEHLDRGEKLQVFFRGKIVEEDVVLRTDAGHAADFVHVVRITNVITENVRGAGRRCRQPGEYVEERGLTGAVVT